MLQLLLLLDFFLILIFFFNVFGFMLLYSILFEIGFLLLGAIQETTRKQFKLDFYY